VNEVEMEEETLTVICCRVNCMLHIWPLFGHSKCFCSYVTITGVWSCVCRARSSTYIELR